MYFVLHRAVRGESGGEDFFFFVGLQVNYRELQPNYRELQPNYRDYVTRAKLRRPGRTTQNYIEGTLDYGHYGHYRNYSHYVALRSGPRFC
jgi:hypothetical protein